MKQNKNTLHFVDQFNFKLKEIEKGHLQPSKHVLWIFISSKLSLLIDSDGDNVNNYGDTEGVDLFNRTSESWLSTTPELHWEEWVSS